MPVLLQGYEKWDKMVPGGSQASILSEQRHRLRTRCKVRTNTWDWSLHEHCIHTLTVHAHMHKEVTANVFRKGWWSYFRNNMCLLSQVFHVTSSQNCVSPRKWMRFFLLIIYLNIPQVLQGSKLRSNISSLSDDPYFFCFFLMTQHWKLSCQLGTVGN